MDKERHLPKESYKTAYITFVRRDHLWNFLCNEDRNDSECGINHECDHMHIMECSNLFCILCTDTGFIDRDSIYLAGLIRNTPVPPYCFCRTVCHTVLAVLTVPFHMIQLVYILFSYLSITFLKMSRKFPKMKKPQSFFPKL